MGRFGDNWATSHRNWRAIFAAVGLSALLVWALTLKSEGDKRKFVKTETTYAIIEKINISQSDSRYAGTTSTYMAYLALADGGKIKFMLLSTPPRVGSKVPVLIDIYDDGSKYYHYSLMDWKLLETR